MNELHNLTIADMRTRLDAGDVTAVQLTDALLTRIASHDGTIGAYLHVDSAREMTCRSPRAGLCGAGNNKSLNKASQYLVMI
jgi:Asp-tRNA(Asn)/Glu-tRNA(Gln) amidotransferase A subunit family amidase